MKASQTLASTSRSQAAEEAAEKNERPNDHSVEVEALHNALDSQQHSGKCGGGATAERGISSSSLSGREATELGRKNAPV